jgi:hypothetical protein
MLDKIMYLINREIRLTDEMSRPSLSDSEKLRNLRIIHAAQRDGLRIALFIIEGVITSGEEKC